MRYRFLLSDGHRMPEDLTATMPLSATVRRWEFDLEDPDIVLAQRIGQGCAFIAGFSAHSTVSRLFYLRHSTETNAARRSTDWVPAVA